MQHQVQHQVQEKAPIITQPTKKPSVLFGTAQELLPKSTTPKVLADGVLRQRIPCRIDDLQAQNPSTKIDILTSALRIIHSVNLDDPHFEDIVRFGEDLQVEHGQMSGTELNIANNEQIAHGQETLNRVLKIIKQLDPEKVFDHEQPSTLKKLAGLIAPKASPSKVFGEYYPQLLTCVEQLKQHEHTLMTASTALSTIKPRYTQLMNETMGYIIAADFMANYIRRNPMGKAPQEHYNAQANALEHRATSLLNTQTTLTIGHHTHDVLAEHLNMLKVTINNVLHEDLPLFYTAYTTALTAKQPNTSAFASLRRIYLKLIEHLNGEKT